MAIWVMPDNDGTIVYCDNHDTSDFIIGSFGVVCFYEVEEAVEDHLESFHG